MSVHMEEKSMDLLRSRSEPYKAKKLWWVRTKEIFRLKLNQFPLVGVPAIRVMRAIKWLLLKCKWEFVTLTRTCGGKDCVDINKVCWVSPQMITYCSLQEFNVFDFKGRVLSGNWDFLQNKFEDLDIFVALKQVCIEGKSWPETIFYQRIRDRISRGEILWNCNDEHDFNQRCRDLEILYEKIRDEGYKSQRDILQSLGVYDPLKVEEEITVSIGRDGDLLFSDGAHRLSIAKLLDIQKVPIKIAVRHPKWVNFRRELYLYAKDQKDGKIYQALTHPDLLDIPAFHNCDDRYTMISKNVSANGGRLLDIGANLGYFCHRFEDEGFDCYAVEDYPTNLYFLKKLKRAENKKFNIIGQSILECSQIRNIHFSVTLALNIFHHFLKTKESYQKFIDLLENLRTEELFFEPHLTGEVQMKDAYRDYTPDEFVKFILQVSRLENAEFIGEAKDGRKLYKLY